MLELFAGSCRTAAALQAEGFEAVAVDKVRSKSAVTAVILADVTEPEGRSIVQGILDDSRLKGIWAAPPCGTCSMAPEIPLFDEQGQAVPGPEPLRSLNFRHGLPTLNAKDRRRVQLANACYEALADIILEMNERGVVMAVENPRSSIFWSTSAWARVAHLFVYTTFQHCAYQGDRPKWTRVAYNHSSFSALCLTCPGELCVKRHRPGGRTAAGAFATSEETAYPPGLARAIAQSFRMAIPFEPVQPLLPLAEMRAAAGSQPKASKVPP